MINLRLKKMVKINKLFLIIGLFLVIGSMNVFGALIDNLVAYYNFDEPSGFLVKDSLNILNGTGNNSILFNQTGIINRSYYFDGVNDCVELPASSSWNFGSGNFTISMWIKPNITSNNGGGLFASATDYWLGYLYSYKNGNPNSNTNNTAMMASTTGTSWTVNGADSTNSATGGNNGINRSNVWNNVVMVRYGTNLSTFINGVFYSNITFSGSLVDRSSQKKYIGSWWGCNNNFYEGNIDEVGIWNDAKNFTEITDLWNNGTGLTYPFGNNTPPVINNITLSSVSPLNYTYSLNQTPIFTFNISAISGTWNTSLILNGTSYGVNNSISSIGLYTIQASTISPGEYLWWINASVNGNSSITEKRNIYIAGASTTSCVVNLGNAYFRPNTCTVFP